MVEKKKTEYTRFVIALLEYLVIYSTVSLDGARCTEDQLWAPSEKQN